MPSCGAGEQRNCLQLGGAIEVACKTLLVDRVWEAHMHRHEHRQTNVSAHSHALSNAVDVQCPWQRQQSDATIGKPAYIPPTWSSTVMEKGK